ncbi:macrophage migration inhibitory factor 2 [Elysia marginata]|uniref:D-dopachrome decarboxylase n=1 Tax=Elysia marginata TaxID=1093978 RepID=A0AAV4HSB8_9GAST|nr:macrophage migration inhibitory factor 2 [Elysia marginata]
MPLCQLFTSRRDSELKEGIELRLAQVVAETLGKPLERVTVVILANQRFLRMGTLEPASLLSITSVGAFDEKRNPTYTPALKHVLQIELDLPAERRVISSV